MVEMRLHKKTVLRIKTPVISKTFIFSFFLLLLIVSCNSNKPDKIKAVVDRTKMPKLHATEITTIISDSGITRYRITASRWDVYDKANQPYQEFPDGIYFEKFDANMKVDANITSKYAKFNENEQLWELKGNVRAMNLQGELFETQQLFWNQRQQRFYSDSLIKITQTTRIITGIGFESNETMTRYMIKNPQGTFPLNEKANTSTPAVTPVPIQSVAMKPKTTAVPILPTGKASIPAPNPAVNKQK
jgi:LPS export ABC transporter protein LptC